MTSPQALWVAVAFVALLNVMICIGVARSGHFSRGQIAAQTALVWLVPFLGAILVGMVLWSAKSPGRHRDASDPMDASGLGGGGPPDGGGHA